MTEIIANPDVEYYKILGRCAELVRRLAQEGLLYDDLQRPINDPPMRRRLIGFWKTGGHDPTTDQERAQDIMGDNYLGIHDVVSCYRMSFSEEEFQKLDRVPFSKQVLQECRDTHVLFCGCKIDIWGIMKVYPQLLDLNPDEGGDHVWLDGRGSGSRPYNRWYLIRKEPLPDSFNVAPIDQIALLKENEVIPGADEIVYLAILYYVVKGEWLFPDVYTRCEDMGPFGDRVCVGGCGSGKVQLYALQNNAQDIATGLAPSIR